MTARVIRRAVAAAGALALAAATVLAASPPAGADPFCTVSWTGGSGSWSDGSHWSSGTAPAPGDYACVLRGAGAPTPVVTVTGAVTVAGLALTGATLRLLALTTTLTAGETLLTRSTVTGRGTLTGTDSGAIRFDDTRLTHGVAVHAQGSLFFTRSLGFAGGSTLDQPAERGLAVFTGPVELADLDGNPANHASLHAFDVQIAPDQVVDVAVPFALRDTAVDVQGDLTLAHLDGFDADGRWAPTVGSYAVLRAVAPTGRVRLPRTITAIGRGAQLDGSGFVAPGDADALLDLRSVQGTLTLRRSLTLPGPLDVAGGVHVQAGATLRTTGVTVRTGAQVAAAGATVAAPVVRVGTGGGFLVSGFTGRLESAGATALRGAKVGGLGLGPTATTTVSLQYPTTVARAARLGGRLFVPLPIPRDLPADGAEVVVLTAASVTGTFSGVASWPVRRGSVTVRYTATQVIAVYHAPPVD